MLSKKQRLSREAFSEHFKSGKRKHTTYATLISSHSPSFHGSVVVSKKVSKKAVTRNSLRRLAYSQLYNAARNIDKGVYILILKPEIISLSRKAQHAALAELIEAGVKSTYNSTHV